MGDDMRSPKTNICFDCKNACGKCPWSAVGKGGDLLYQPVPGWTAERVTLNSNGVFCDTYHITACPMFEPDMIEIKCKKGNRQPVYCVELDRYFGSITSAAKHAYQVDKLRAKDFDAFKVKLDIGRAIDGRHYKRCKVARVLAGKDES